MTNDSSGSPRRPRGRTTLAVILVTLGILLAPVSTVAAWARIEVLDTNTFVATFAPLADDPAVQSYLSEQAVAAINRSIDIPKITSDAIDGLAGLGAGPLATAALDSLKGAAAQAVRDVIENQVSRFVASDAFAVTWAKTLRLSHTQLMATLSADPNAVISADQRGTIGIELGPIVERLKTVLVAKGLGFAERIPAVDRTIVIANSDVVPVARFSYTVVAVTGTWLPWLALLLLVAAVLVAQRRVRTIVWTAVTLAVVMILLGLAVVWGRYTFLVAVRPVPVSTAGPLYDQFVAGLSGTIVAVAVFASITAVAAWLFGPFRAARSVRGFTARWLTRLRAAVRPSARKEGSQ
ncbi:hypothetical protein [Lacisediminihabitans profunda]|uniref:Integral membrane protein n=1 Tax=Lacisediminihabitans profunda TaxID=2594790 RepID=A0A5C8UWL0_9MICO|nr:hypothetical protein [Lacisediminihabitans profunda]TXN31987.1 hypothetical protein FVP33_03430 [Lacisediminihabitans profunda]